MYAKVINEQTKSCEVGTGTNTDFYKSIGMTEQDVEKGYDGCWYIAGYAPIKPEEIRKKEEIETLKKFLFQTDYIVIKIAEKQVKKDEKGSDEDLKKYSDILAERAAARERINELEGNVK